MINLLNNFGWGRELTNQEIGAIHSSEDYEIISLIRGIPSEELSNIDASICVKREFMKEYNCTQIPWISDFQLYYCENHHIDSDKKFKECLGDICDAMQKDDFPKVFKLYFALKNPDKIEIIYDCEEIRKFVSLLEQKPVFNLC